MADDAKLRKWINHLLNECHDIENLIPNFRREALGSIVVLEDLKDALDSGAFKESPFITARELLDLEREGATS